MATTTPRAAESRTGGGLTRAVAGLPPVSFFVVSAIFHYLGPSLAVMLFAHIAALGVMWLRIASAAAVFAVWRRPWRLAGRLDRRQQVMLLALGGVLAGMNALFYLAVARLPLATVGAIEFLGIIVVAALGVRTRRNAAAPALAIAGVAALTAIRVTARPLGYMFAFGNCAGFMLYVMLGHRVANTRVTGAGGGTGDGETAAAGVFAGIDQLGAAMLIAVVAATPAGLAAALPAFTRPAWLAWGIGVGVCSSVIPYVTDQLAMARLPRARFALMLALLPAFAAITGTVVLGQIPTGRDLAGIGLVIAGVAIHQAGTGNQEAPAAGGAPRTPGSASAAGHRLRRAAVAGAAADDPGGGGRQP